MCEYCPLDDPDTEMIEQIYHWRTKDIPES